MTGVLESHGEWSEGVYENTFVKDSGVWKIKDLRYFPTFITDYEQGWAKDAKPAPTASAELPPDRPPTSVYAIYPKAHIPPFHYDNPVDGAEPRYPRGRGGPSERRSPRCARPSSAAGGARAALAARDAEALLAHAEQQVARVKDFHEIDNLDERVRLLPRQESLERSRELVRRGRLDRARAARRLHRPRTRARIPVQRVRRRRPDRRTGSAITSSGSR